jgi:hypothetical protein
MLLAISIVTIVGSVALVAFTFHKYEHLKDRHKLTAAMATATMGAAMLMVAILPDGLGQSIEGAIVAVVSVGMFGVTAVSFYILALRLWRNDHAPASTWAGPLAVPGPGRRFPMWAHDDPRRITIEKWFAAGCFLLFAYNVLAWQGLVGDEPPFRPVQSVLLSAGLLLMSVAAVARDKKMERLSYVLLAAAVIAGGLSFVIG